MTVLLDTHAFLWAIRDPKKLSKPALERLRNQDGDLAVSVASLWEIGILASLHRIELQISIEQIVELSAREIGTDVLSIEPKHIDCMRNLPFHHRDPFDRLIAAQALSSAATLIGRDEVFDAYGVQRIW